MRFDDWLAARTAKNAALGRPRDLPISADELRARYEAGASVSTLAIACGAPESTIRYRLVTAGTKMRPGGWPRS